MSTAKIGNVLFICTKKTSYRLPGIWSLGTKPFKKKDQKQKQNKKTDKAMKHNRRHNRFRIDIRSTNDPIKKIDSQQYIRV